MPLPAINLSASNKPVIGHIFTVLESVDSTNNYAMARVHEGSACHGMVWFGQLQTAGRGQRGRTWTSAAGENIMMSIVLEPAFLLPSQSFFLSACIAAGCHKWLSRYILTELSIKWPNDIYWRDRKAGGMLLENNIQGHTWRFCIAGMGININQTNFPPELSRAVSLKQITGASYPAESLALELCHFIELSYQQLRTEGIEPILAYYNQHLYKRGESVLLKKNSRTVYAFIEKVTEQGRLLSSIGELEFGEVEWLQG